MGRKKWGGLGCAAVVGAAIAFPAGVVFGGRDTGREMAAPAPAGGHAGRPVARNVYSPKILNDPYFLDQQRRLVDTLEAQCRTRKAHCAEAEQARRWLDRQGASR